MKRSFLFSLLFYSVLSCTNSGQSGESTSDSTAVAKDSTNLIRIKVSGSRWIIPLTDYWKDKDHFILLLPDDSYTNLFPVPTLDQQPAQVYDTLQGKVIGTAKGPFGDCDILDLLQIEVGKNKQRGWIAINEGFTIGRLGMGTFSTSVGELKLGEMNLITRTNQQERECSTLRLLFFYDESYLYLIDKAETDDSSLFWDKTSYVSLIDAPPGIYIGGQNIGKNLFEMKWGVPNGKVTFRVEFKGNHIVYNYYNMEAVEGDAEEGGPIDAPPDSPDDSVAYVGTGDPKTVTCVLQDASMSDCYYITFDCMDLGDAKTKLTDVEKDLWDSITITDKNVSGGVAVNPKYKGKTFEIIYQMTKARACGDPAGPQPTSDVELIIGFKLKP